MQSLPFDFLPVTAINSPQQAPVARIREQPERENRILFDIVVGASPQDVLNLIGWPNGEGTIIVVGHQPTLGQVASLLLTGKEADGQIKKGAIWWFRTRGEGLEMETLLHAVISPELL